MDVWFYVVMWLVLAAFFVYLEFETVVLISIWFGLGALAAALVAAFKVELTYQLITFAIVSLVTLLAIKIFFPNLSLKTTSDKQENRLIGKEVIVTEDITHLKSGSGKIDGVTWTLTCNQGEAIYKGQVVRVVSVSGNKLLVKLEKGI